MLRKRWYRCHGVGSVSGRPYLSRFAITKDVSRMGTASASSGKKSATVAAVFSAPWIATAARMKPSRCEPESPMKIRAG
jgi:hypothetical protein